jgi:hypothetical protein
VDKRILRIISKLGLLFVVIGFFMPISCDISGFDFTKAFLINPDAPLNNMIEHPLLTGIMIFVMFFVSCVGIIFMMMLINRKNLCVSYDWIVTLVSISSGLIAYIGLKDFFKHSFQIGGYLIIIGWSVSLVCMIITKYCRE